MADDEDSLSNPNKTTSIDDNKCDHVTELSADTSVVANDMVVADEEVLGEEAKAEAVAEVSASLEESSKVAGDSSQLTGGGGGDVEEEVVAVTENEVSDEAVEEGRVAPEVGEPLRESNVAGDSSRSSGGDVEEVVNVTVKSEENDEALEEGNVVPQVGAPSGESNVDCLQRTNVEVKSEVEVVATVPKTEKVENEEVEEGNKTDLEKDDAMEVIKDEENSSMPSGAVAEEVVVGRNENEENDEAVADATIVEGTTESETDGVIEAIQPDIGSGMQIGADAETVLVTNNDNVEDGENGQAVVEANVSTVETSLGLGKDGEMEAMKGEEAELPAIVKEDLGGVSLEEEDEAIGAEDETETDGDADAEKVDVTQNEDNDETLSDADISTAEAGGQMEKDEEMDIMKQEEVEPASMLDGSDDVPLDEEDETMGVEDETNEATEVETETDMTESGSASGGKRKRRNVKSPAKSKAAARASSTKTVGEDVCFICFDGGDMVLCDRRGCSKAYHPSCIDRDEKFFRAKGRWNCGWHQCTICEKNAYYMCYTCTFSLCKGCLKDDVIQCVRGNKGFCKNCMRIVKLIEGHGQEDEDVPIDFDDKNSFEYLFKDYFVDLKAKLSLSSDEIVNAKSPWKGSDVPANKQVAEVQFDNNYEGASGSDDSIETLEASKTRRRRVKKRSKSLRKEEDPATTAVVTGSEGFSTAGTTVWASKELLDFVKHMKDGDTSVLSQFDVQALLLEYIKTNKLRDPRRKSQIICDSRLESLFGKPRVGHFEMLKLLESHFFMKEDSQTDDVQGSVVDTELNQSEADGNADALTRGVKDRKRKRRKGGNRGAQSNLDDYAAIDVHNISLIYLRRKLMEDLLEENDKFLDRVGGTFVRIRISGSAQKQDIYRLVQVIGTSNAEPYKLGKRTTNIMLEILNLNKTEVISIDSISNQDFTEEECKRLRQSIKCGLINRPTVGDILDKAMEIQSARVNDWLESEVLRLSHLRDRASEKGRKKELRECVEKLQLLKTPDERRRRLEEVPEIHADPNMDPSYESEEEDSENVFARSRDSSFSRRGREPVSPASNFSPKDSRGGAGKFSSKNWELDRSLSGNKILSRSDDGSHSGEIVNGDAWNQVRDRDSEYKNLENTVSAANAETSGWNSHVVSRSESFSGVTSVPSPATLPSKVAEVTTKINETEKMWHYKDPSDKIQGPFSMVQLRKWNNTGYFPADLKIWRSTENQDASILLTDALAGKLEKVSPAIDSILPTAVMKNRDGERLNADQNLYSQNSPRPLVSPGGGMTSSREVSALSTERWSNSGTSNLPSPTPKKDTSSWVEGDGLSVTAANLFSGGNRVLPSPPALPDGGVHPSVSASVQNSGGHSIRGSENNVNSGTDFGLTPTDSALSANPLQNAQSIQFGEQLTALLSSQSGAQDPAVQSIRSLNIQNPSVDAHSWVAAAPSNGEPNLSVPAPGQPQSYGNLGTNQNPAANFSNAGASVLPQPDYWSGQVQSSQPNMQPPTVPSVPWNVGSQENTMASALIPENQNTSWGMMPGNPNMGWVGPVPPTMNVNWGATVQAMPPGNSNPGWVMPTGPLPGNMNPGWVAPSGNSGVQGFVPGNVNPGWVSPTASIGSTVQGAMPGNGWAGGTGNPGNLVQGPPQGGSNQGWSAPTGSRDTRNNDRHQNGGNFSGQMDRDSRGSNSRYNRQSSFGSRGPGGSSRGSFKNIPCPYNTNGRCVKGSRCNYLHS